MVLLTIINGTIGASTAGKSPMDKATRLGIKPIKMAASTPNKAAEINRIALTIGPVIYCRWIKAGSKVATDNKTINFVKGKACALVMVNDFKYIYFILFYNL
ncbi:hypothetical protein COT99_04110 [Candidatus Falkowbacteria bacterium CG10_big_fil_rev_8_21_14_0_10_43_10]|uniref:Uncharacterized protein n=1 Tax=Candidatus Falkowbacteria bacterium CG10_big_fil_rev_8_21_14_0_10_43_10 TaxID=1974567 RepID=A0A2H0V159_9BACT|nr:MAG: hypothetical protein COT99_04110 [Candidatus Falkowbacteria bacterium CG10_big_fil_rev_8_21_14_0_10_43_10]